MRDVTLNLFIWINTIGDMETTEGYAIKVMQNVDLEIDGTMVELPLTIPLSEGWNIIGFPKQTEQDAL